MTPMTSQAYNQILAQNMPQKTNKNPEYEVENFITRTFFSRLYRCKFQKPYDYSQHQSNHCIPLRT